MLRCILKCSFFWCFIWFSVYWLLVKVFFCFLHYCQVISLVLTLGPGKLDGWVPCCLSHYAHQYFIQTEYVWCDSTYKIRLLTTCISVLMIVCYFSDIICQYYSPFFVTNILLFDSLVVLLLFIRFIIINFNIKFVFLIYVKLRTSAEKNIKSVFSRNVSSLFDEKHFSESSCYHFPQYLYIAQWFLSFSARGPPFWFRKELWAPH